MQKAVQILDASGTPVRARPRVGALTSMSGGFGGAYTGGSLTHQDLARWTPRNYSPNEALASSRNMLQARVHDLARNDGWASAAMTRQVDMVVGSGWMLAAKPIASRLGIDQEVADELADQIEDVFNEDCADPRFLMDAQESQPMAMLLALAFRHSIVDGEAFGVLHWLPERPIATALEVIHPDRCSNPPGRRDGFGIRSGIELNDRGAPTAYNFLVAHPDELFIGQYSKRWERVPRYTSFGRPQVIHAFNRTEAGQVRGVSVLAPVIKKLRMLSRYDEAELQAAVLNAVLAAFVTTPYDGEQVANMIGVQDAELSAFQEMRRGIYGDTPIALDGIRVNFLAPGDKAEFLDAKFPNSVYEPFVRSALRNIASATGTSYEQLSMDWSQVNYSSARGALIEIWRSATTKRDNFAGTFMQPYYYAWLEEQVDKGRVVPPAGCKSFEDAPGAWVNADWIGPGRGWIDPFKEARGAAQRLDSGISSLEREAAEQGYDWKAMIKQRARETRLRQEYGDVPVAKPTDPAQQAQMDAEAAQEDNSAQQGA